MAAASPLNHPIPHSPVAPIEWNALRRFRGVLLAALCVAWIPAAVFSLAEALPRLSADRPPVVSEDYRAAVSEARVVPLEWRWSPPGVAVDRMFRRSR
jgi:hypothetical protein